MNILRSVYTKSLCGLRPHQLVAMTKVCKSSSAMPTSTSPTIQSDQPGEKDDMYPAKEWSSYGCDLRDYYVDRYNTHWMFFLYISLSIVGGVFVLSYAPDWNRNNWAQREAYILLREREAKGLPFIDCNYIDPQHIVLPSEEELQDVEIII